jgi:hypothetical protein
MNVVRIILELIEDDLVDLENTMVVFYQRFDRIPFEVEFLVHEFSTNGLNHKAIPALIDVILND